MTIDINNNKYNVIIEYKAIKNMYLRVKDDLNIYITAPKYINNASIKNFINNNMKFIINKIKIIEIKKSNQVGQFLFLGDYYDINYVNGKKIIFNKDQVYIGESCNIDSFYKKEASSLFKERLDYCYNLFSENIPYPNLKLRKMTTKWGVCNITKKQVTLNLDLIKMEIKYLDYVIIHELSHFIYSNHSKNFWSLVEKYEKNYKTYRKEMKNKV